MARKAKPKTYALDTDWLIKHQEKVINNLDEESLAAYSFIKQQWDAGDVKNNKLFQFVFRSFYRIDNAGLTKDFKEKYFELMEDNRINAAGLDIEHICKELHGIKRHKGDNSLQFSFVTKMANTLCDNMPIYDSEVARMYGFTPPNTENDIDKKLEKLTGFYEILKSDYAVKINDVKLQGVFEAFDKKFAGYKKMSKHKKLDFIVWSAGKLYKKAKS